LRRANGRCEFCGRLGFITPDGGRYLESRHVIALANDGKNRLTPDGGCSMACSAVVFTFRLLRLSTQSVCRSGYPRGH
jgi:hypothetical protein